MEQTPENIFYDVGEPLGVRKDTLKRAIFEKDIFLPKGFLEKSKITGTVLDLGCGRGAIGAVLRDVNPEIKLVGCDILGYLKAKNFLDLYSEVRKAPAYAVLQEAAEKGEKFDMIISCGLPFSAIEDIFDNVDFVKVVKEEGVVLFMFDDIPEKEVEDRARSKGFIIREGHYPADQSIWFKG